MIYDWEAAGDFRNARALYAGLSLAIMDIDTARFHANTALTQQMDSRPAREIRNTVTLLKRARDNLSELRDDNEPS